MEHKLGLFARVLDVISFGAQGAPLKSYLGSKNFEKHILELL